MNIKFFETKEQYLAFRAAWRAAVNHERAKANHDSWIHATHHILLNIVRGKEPNYGFTPITNQVKLDNGSYPWVAYNQALQSLKWIQQSAVSATQTYESYIEKRAGWLLKGKTEEQKHEAYVKQIAFERRCVDRLLEPFNGALTIEDLLRVELPEPIYE